MHAMVLSRFGGPELFEVRDIERPTPGPGQLLVRVIASGTNPVDAKLRADGSWAHLQPPVVLGYDAAGVVEDIGVGVTDFQIGDEVYYTPEIFANPQGTYAEYNTVPASLVGQKPGNLSFEEAAAVPLAGGTAWDAVIRRLQVRAGETVLIQGGAGGVGSFAVQFAKAAGARVLASAGSTNQDTLRELGADVVIDYRKENPTEVALDQTRGQGVDAVFDIEGPDLVARSLPAVRPGGRVACVLAPQGDLSLLYPKNITLHGVFLTRERARLEQMRPLFERGQVKPLMDTVLPLEQVASAHERLDSGHGRGKVVLRVAGA
ncbi:MAG TPA: zinc-dependent alcohol dehydrogenase family protein [Gammaproteobacteria bacterium]|nr:zinc-dependent alcohol dehydrogenase family protein [Gammaproteobacteria bacterium]